MCTMIVRQIAVEGSGKRPQGWFDLGQAVVEALGHALATRTSIWMPWFASQ